MTSLQPLAFVLLALTIPTFGYYLWKKRITSRKVPSTLILRAIAIPVEPPRRGMSKPRHAVSLALVLLSLVAAALAVADVRRRGEEPRDLVVVLDTSASMGAKEREEQTRLDLAVDKLASLMSSLRSGDRVALVTTGGENLVRVGLTEDYAGVVRIARTLKPSGTSDLSASALELADGICKKAKRGHIVLVSDGVGVAAPETTCEVEHLAVGTDVPNAGISELSVREGDALGLSEVHVAVTSVLGKGRRAEVAILAGNRVVEILAVDLPARGKIERLLRVKLPPGAPISAELKMTESDALPADDIATAPHTEGGRVKTLLVTPRDRSFVAEALRLHPRVDLNQVKAADPLPDDFEPDLVILEAMPSTGKVPAASRVVTFGLAPDAVGLQAGEPVQKPDVVRWAYGDPLFRYVDFQGVKIPEATMVVPTKSQRMLIDAEQGTIALLDLDKNRELVFVGFAPDNSDLVLRVGFVNFIANLVEWAAHSSSVGERKGVLSPTESATDPPDELAGAKVPRTSKPLVPDLPIWRVALLGALALITAEIIVQAVAGSRRNIAARVNKMFEPKKKPVDPDDEEVPISIGPMSKKPNDAGRSEGAVS